MMEKYTIRGRVLRYGDNIDTDVIIPARYLVYTDPEVLASHAMEGIDPDFPKKVRSGMNVIIAGRNFGCGSSREHAVIALKHAGVRAIIAESFARIFFRNAVNLGLPLIECSIPAEIGNGEIIEVYLKRGEIIFPKRGKKFEFKPLPDFLLKIIERGGLIGFLREKLQANSR